MTGQDMGRRCAACGRPAVFGYPSPGQQGPDDVIPFCLEHSDQYEAMLQRRDTQLQHHIDRLDDDIHDIVGLPRPHRPARVTQRILVNAVHIHGNNSGLINNGTIGAIENNLSVLSSIDQTLATTIKALTEAVLASELTQPEKQEAADLLASVSAEVAKTPEKRSPVPVLKAIGGALDKLLTRVPGAVALWKVVAETLG